MTVNRTQLRARLIAELKTDADFNAFVQDHFFDESRQFSRGMSRTERINLLFESRDIEEIASALDAHLQAGRKEASPASPIASSSAARNPVRMVLLHAPEDTKAIEPLRKQLAALARAGQVALWSPDDIEPGMPTAQKLAEALKQADLVLAMVSADLLADNDLDQRLRELVTNKAIGQVVPILVRPAGLAHTALDGLTPLPANRRAVSQWSDREAAWAEIASELSRLISARARPIA